MLQALRLSMPQVADAIVRLAAIVSAGPDFRAILTARGHRVHIDAARAAVINQRTQAVAAIFAALTVAWIVVDAAVFEPSLWLALALCRVAASAGFMMIALRRSDPRDMRVALWNAGGLFAVPVVFFAVSTALLARFEPTETSVSVAVAYQGLPFIVAAGLSIFPLTAKEHLILGAVLLAAFGAMIAITGGVAQGWPDSGLIWLANHRGGWSLGAVWLLILIAVLAGTAGVLQLQLLFVLIERSARDGLTGLLTRRFGEETLDLQFHTAMRTNGPLSLVFIDLDHFKSINDRYGHEAGDEVLRNAARHIVAALRRQDAAIRWGGEEFLLLLPNTGSESALSAVMRLARAGLGTRPDGRPLTASIGLAERTRDSAPDWQGLAELADRRMYAAKASGRNCVAGPDNLMRPFIVARKVDG
jgi:diguanylate cyclase (GGDEF)-like protein